MIKEIAIMNSEAELSLGEKALEIGNVGKARVCARRACYFVISFWLRKNPQYNFGNNAMNMLNGVSFEKSFPEEIRNSAERLTKKVNENFDTGFKENPIDDARTIINYFLEKS